LIGNLAAAAGNAPAKDRNVRRFIYRDCTVATSLS